MIWKCVIRMGHKHGMSNTRLYKIWEGMKNRCNYSSHNSYKYYGGRGIKVSDEWLEFVPFMEWALEHGYKDGLTIDRKDVNGNYEPDNYKWIIMKEQQNNKRNNVRVEINGIVDTLTGWSKHTGLNLNTLINRYYCRKLRGEDLIKGLYCDYAKGGDDFER